MTYLITEEKNKRLPRQRKENMKIIGSMSTWSYLRSRKVKEENKPNKQNFSMQTKACSRNGIHGLYSFHMTGSRLHEMFEKVGRYRFIFSW